MRLDVVIPAHNCEKTIIKTVNSIYESIGTCCNIIVVDDGSTDDTLKLLKDTYDDFSNISIYTKINGGPSSARKLGVHNSSGDYIWFVDAGDLINVDSCQDLLSFLESEKPDVLIFDYLESINEDTIYRKQRIDDNDLTKSLLLNKVAPGMFTKIFKRNNDVIDRFSEIEDIWLGEDLCFSIMSSLEVNKISYIPKPFYIYVRDTGSLSMNPSADKELTIINSVDQIKKSLKIKELFDEYKNEFEYMCFSRLIIDSVLLSANKRNQISFMKYFSGLNVNKDNIYIKNIYWIFYFAKVKTNLPFQNYVTFILKTLIRLLSKIKASYLK